MVLLFQARLTQVRAAIAVVQWTHTLQMRNALLLARLQLARRRPATEHHVVLQVCGEGAHSTVPEKCEAAMAQLPFSENVTCFHPTLMTQMVPSLGTIKRVFLNSGPSTSAAELAVGAPRWCWHNCDGAYLAWFRQHGAALTHITFFWFVEWDVVWTGDIGLLLGSWGGVGDARSPRDEDLLCANPEFAGKRWAHLHKRNKTLIPFEQVYKCDTGLYRVTHRLLSEMVAFGQQPEAAMFCEIRAPTVCMRLQHSKSSRHGLGCKMRSFFDQEHERNFFGSRTQWVDSYAPGRGFNRNGIEAIRRRAHPHTLIHSYKWGSTAQIIREKYVRPGHGDGIVTRPDGTRINYSRVAESFDERAYNGTLLYDKEIARLLSKTQHQWQRTPPSPHTWPHKRPESTPAAVDMRGRA